MPRNCRRNVNSTIQAVLETRGSQTRKPTQLLGLGEETTIASHIDSVLKFLKAAPCPCEATEYLAEFHRIENRIVGLWGNGSEPSLDDAIDAVTLTHIRRSAEGQDRPTRLRSDRIEKYRQD